MRTLPIKFSEINLKLFLILVLTILSKHNCNNENILNNSTSKLLESNSNSSKCTEKICDLIGGECIDDETCKCRSGFTTLLRNSNLKLCNYERKSSILAAFIELFLGFGLGHLYSGRKIFGIFKLFVSCLLCCIA
jgi:hypothetical protein